ncbi:MAG TPA: hypothetical protein VM759_00085 [Longimicrobium sp.]|nr:hypothetical protein [Longimicrobium sp.]
MDRVRWSPALLSHVALATRGRARGAHRLLAARAGHAAGFEQHYEALYPEQRKSKRPPPATQSAPGPTWPWRPGT